MNEPSLRSLVSSIVRNLLEGVRRNKLATSLALLAFLGGGALAFSSQYDERPRYREVILPDIERAEALFFRMLSAAENPPSEDWRLSYFLTAHIKAKDILHLAKARQPKTRAGMKAHAELIRYYDLVIEELAIIRTQMSVDEDMDYLAAWRTGNARLKPIRDRWLSWVKS